MTTEKLFTDSRNIKDVLSPLKIYHMRVAEAL